MPSTSTAVHPSRPTATGEPVALYAVDAAGIERAVTHRELAEQVDRAAAAMRRLGVRAGDRVALHLPLGPEAVAALLACTRIGAVATTLTQWPSLRDHPCDELAVRRLRRIRLLVTTGEVSGELLPPVLVAPTDGAWPGPAPQPADASPAAPTVEERSTALRLGLHGPDDVYWCAVDLDWLVRHPAAVSAPLALGAAQVVCADVTNVTHQRLWATLHTYGVTVLHAHPDALHDVLWRSRLTDPDTPDAPELRLITPTPDAGTAATPDYWSWHRAPEGSTSGWHLQHGPNPWSPLPTTDRLRR
ncbi:AMP-binding protein [Kitasatospora sp. NPDC004669]|uniref:AMP-binding protein n=1 Tax=Kitasatospora sp. NPDC004669 TaxID=3154555 RepID=UPI0033BC21F0